MRIIRQNDVLDYKIEYFLDCNTKAFNAPDDYAINSRETWINTINMLLKNKGIKYCCAIAYDAKVALDRNKFLIKFAFKRSNKVVEYCDIYDDVKAIVKLIAAMPLFEVDEKEIIEEEEDGGINLADWANNCTQFQEFCNENKIKFKFPLPVDEDPTNRLISAFGKYMESTFSELGAKFHTC